MKTPEQVYMRIDCVIDKTGSREILTRASAASEHQNVFFGGPLVLLVFPYCQCLRIENAQ